MDGGRGASRAWGVVRDAYEQETQMIGWPDPPRDEKEIADAVRLYDQMWSIERIAEIFGSS